MLALQKHFRTVGNNMFCSGRDPVNRNVVNIKTSSFFSFLRNQFFSLVFLELEENKVTQMFLCANVVNVSSFPRVQSRSLVLRAEE